MLQFVAMTVSEGECYLYFETQYPDSLIDMAVSFKPDLIKSQKMTKMTGMNTTTLLITICQFVFNVINITKLITLFTQHELSVHCFITGQF